MERIEKTVFISYRRTSASWALAIYQNLTQHGFDVFLDYNGIASGDFERVILENIGARAHFLVLLTPSALDRCGDPADWLRREIEAALVKRRNIVPLTLDGFDFGSPLIAGQLSGSLAPLKNYNAIRIPPDFFDEAMERLRAKFLNVPLTAVLHPASVLARQAAVEQGQAMQAAPAVSQDELTALQYFERAAAATEVSEKLRLWSETIRLNPKLAPAFGNRGVLRTELLDYEGAVSDFDEAIRLRPDLADSYGCRSAVWIRTGNFEAAIRDSTEAIRLRPTYANAFVNRAAALIAQGDFNGAIRDSNEAILLDPNSAAAFDNRGFARFSGGDREGAIDDYNLAIRLDAKLVNAFHNRGLARHSLGDHSGAVDDFTEAIRLAPQSAVAFFSRGTVHLFRRDYKKAILDLTEAIHLKPHNPDAYNNRGLARRARLEWGGAMEDFEHAKRLRASANAQ